MAEMPAQPSRLKVAQQVVGMLMGGIGVLSLGAMLFVGTGSREPAEPAPGPAEAQLLPREGLTAPLAVVAVVLAIVALAAPIWLARTVERRVRGDGEGRDLAGAEVFSAYKLYSVKRVLGAAALGVFCPAAAIFSGELWFLAGAALALVVMGAVFPTRRGQLGFHQRVTGHAPSIAAAAADLPA